MEHEGAEKREQVEGKGNKMKKWGKKIR